VFPLPSALTHNWRLKLSALGLSVFLWALVQAEPRNQETFSAVPVRVELKDTAWALSGAPIPTTVELRLGGPAREIIGLAREGTTLRIPLGEVGSLDTIVTLRRDWVDLGGRTGVTVESVSPSTVALAFEPAAVRMLPVALRVQGRVPDRVALASGVGVNPSLVRVRGPASRIAGLDSIVLETFDLGTVTRSGVFTVPVDTSGLGGAVAEPPNAGLSIQVEDLVVRTLTGILVVVEPPPGGDRLVADPVSVSLRLEGARSLVTAIDATALRAWVAPELLTDMAAGEVRRVPISIDGIPDLVSVAADTETVLVRRAADLSVDPGWSRR